MSIKILVAGILLLTLTLFLSWPRKVRTNKPHDLVIETVGLDDFDIHLEAPYGKQSPYHALIVNDSSHNLIACDVVFELLTEDGRVLPGRRVVAYRDLLEANPTARQTLLKSYPGIAPQSKMLLGMGVEPDLVQVFDKLPEIGRLSAEVELNDSVKTEKLIIRLDAVVIENGEAFGPKGREFLTHLKESVLKEEQP